MRNGVTESAWCQERGFEWLYRACQEPGRLGRRYLTTNSSFMTLVVREMMRRRAADHGLKQTRGGSQP
jgi:UDP-N-acetyl-D-mannosaminuronic acid transferase (WecB/TagA/CpsF family)